MHVLVGVAHQAVIAGGNARFGLVLCSEIIALFVKVADFKSAARQGGDHRGIFHDLMQDPGAAFGSLVKEKVVRGAAARQCLRSQFGIFQLVLLQDSLLQGCLQGIELRCGKLNNRADEKTVFPVLHIRDDPDNLAYLRWVFQVLILVISSA